MKDISISVACLRLNKKNQDWDLDTRPEHPLSTRMERRHQAETAVRKQMYRSPVLFLELTVEAPARLRIPVTCQDKLLQLMRWLHHAGDVILPAQGPEVGINYL